MTSTKPTAMANEVAVLAPQGRRLRVIHTAPLSPGIHVLVGRDRRVATKPVPV